MNVLIGLFVIGCIALAGMVASISSTAIGGGILVLCGLVAGGLNLLRSLPSTSRSSLARRGGLGLFGVGLISCTAVGAALGSSAWRAVAAEQEAKRLAEEQRIATLVAAAPSISPILDVAEEQLTQGRLEGCVSELGRAEGRLKELRGHENLSPLIARLDQRLAALRERHQAEIERVAVASAEAAQQVAGVAGLEAMLSAREVLRAVPRPSLQATIALGTLEQKLTAEARKTGVISQPIVLLDAHLFATPPTKSADGYSLGHVRGAKGLASVAAGKCTGLYLAAEPRPSALSDAAATEFVELSVGPLKAPPLWKAPPGSGARTVTRTHNGVAIHEGWFDERLVELWAGDFKP